MGLIRLVIFALVIWLIWRMIKNYQVKQKNKNRQSANNKISNTNMVACHYCTVHVPENEAVAHEEKWFCSDKHKAKFLEGDR